MNGIAAPSLTIVSHMETLLFAIIMIGIYNNHYGSTMSSTELKIEHGINNIVKFLQKYPHFQTKFDFFRFFSLSNFSCTERCFIHSDDGTASIHVSRSCQCQTH